jgi:hypothetical protein
LLTFQGRATIFLTAFVFNQYRFITRWRVQASPEEVFDILRQPLEYPRWWPSVYLKVRETGSDCVRLLTRGWLPYTLSWDSRTTASREPTLLAVQATGDFAGRGIWSFVADGEFTDISFDWQVTALKPLIRRLSFLLKPVFEANHRWAMEQGLRSLELELRRYRAASVEEVNSIPDPPQAHSLFTREVISGAALAAVLIAGLVKSGS